ncbi:MAG: hypothetical protein RLN88_01500 [Ekhidna sp.]|uniref:hypothetical protein n=1 Tax=Ekhidna sp. TaxID=2608089 RepID=UPI0032EE6A52
MKRILAGVACFFVLGHIVLAQSIYSFQGLGSLNHQGMPNNFAMGEVGIGTPSVWHINTQNPANLVYNNFSTFQVGLEVDRRKFSGDDVSGSDTGGGLRFLAYAFPIMPGKWSSSFGVLPYSSVSYNTFSSGEIPGTDGDVSQISDNRGEGGLTNFFWSNGFMIKNKFLVGLRINYTFGSIEKKTTISIGGTDVPLSNVTYEELESYSDLNVLFGAGYKHKISDGRYINFGAIYSPKSSLNGTSELFLIRLTNTGGEIETVPVGESSLQFDLPQLFGLGASYERANLYKIGFDLETQRWSKAGEVAQRYNNSLKVALGMEWTPDYDNVSSYFKRIKYSAGFNYYKLPYIVNDQALTDFGINFGASLPVSGFSSLDLAFKWGQLGESSNGLIKETYYKIVIGATINDRWFIKRKYD